MVGVDEYMPRKIWTYLFIKEHGFEPKMSYYARTEGVRYS